MRIRLSAGPVAGAPLPLILLTASIFTLSTFSIHDLFPAPSTGTTFTLYNPFFPMMNEYNPLLTDSSHTLL